MRLLIADEVRACLVGNGCTAFLARRPFRVLRQVVVDAHPRQLGGHENVALGRELVRVVESSERNPQAPCAGPLRQHASAARRAEDAPENASPTARSNSSKGRRRDIAL